MKTQSKRRQTDGEKEDKIKSQLNESRFEPHLIGYFAVCLIVCRVIAALVQPIADCDEVFNYWEPTHLILHHNDSPAHTNSFQTWEYSPEFALRSYLYVVIHAAIAKLWALIWPLIMGTVATKIQVFYGVRVTLSVFCALCETVFIRGVAFQLGNRIAHVTFWFMLFGSGLFNASASYLPSTFTMYFLMLAFGFWFHANHKKDNSYNNFYFTLALLSTALAGLIGWPFCIVAVVPFGFHILFKLGLLRFIVTSVAVLAAPLAGTILVDYFFYGKIMFTPLNLLMYNRGSGSQLYGVEPWTFYFKNLFLNFNFVSVLAYVSPLIIIMRDWLAKHEEDVRKQMSEPKSSLFKVCLVLAFHLWTGFLTMMPHKEERFLYLVYPTLCLSGSVALCYGLELLISTSRRRHVQNIIILLAVFVYATISTSRTIAINKYYGAPLTVYSKLHDHIVSSSSSSNNNNNKNTIVACVGKEWYRYPSSFFMPRNAHLGFVKSKFDGMLPKLFEKSKQEPGNLFAITKAMPQGLNDQNREDMSTYTDIAQCDYLVDYDFAEQAEEHYVNNTEQWELIHEEPFLDSIKSPQLTRSFYIPSFLDPIVKTIVKSQQQGNVYGRYVLLKKKK